MMSTSTIFWSLATSLSRFSGFLWPMESLVQTPPTLQSSAHLPDQHKIDVLHTLELSSIRFYFSSEAKDLEGKLQTYFSIHRAAIFLDPVQEAKDIKAYWNKEKEHIVNYEDPEEKGPFVKMLQNAIEDLQRPTFHFEIEDTIYEHPFYYPDKTEGKENTEEIVFKNKRYVYQFAKTLTEK